MKKFFAFILPLLVGIVIGILIMGLLSMRASKMYLEVLRINYEHEQEMLAARARRDGVVDVCLPNELRAFENTAAIWDFAFPFATPVLEAIGDIPEKDRAYQINKGFKLARLADTLERAGLRDDATSTWKEAAKLLGHNDVKKARSLVKNLKQSDDELLKSLESPNEVVE